MEAKVIAMYSIDYCEAQINQWIDIYNYLTDLMETTEDMAVMIHWNLTREHVAGILEDWIYKHNRLT